jgi:hypothetical protein
VPPKTQDKEKKIYFHAHFILGIDWTCHSCRSPNLIIIPNSLKNPPDLSVKEVKLSCHTFIVTFQHRAKLGYTPTSAGQYAPRQIVTMDSSQQTTHKWSSFPMLVRQTERPLKRRLEDEDALSSHNNYPKHHRYRPGDAVSFRDFKLSRREDDGHFRDSYRGRHHRGRSSSPQSPMVEDLNGKFLSCSMFRRSMLDARPHDLLDGASL